MVMFLLSGLGLASGVSDWEAYVAERGLVETARAVLDRIAEGDVERARMQLAASGFGRLRFPVSAVEPERFPGLTDATGCSWNTGIQCEFAMDLAAPVDATRLVARCLDASDSVVGRPVGTQVLSARGPLRVAVTDLELCWGAGGVRLRLSERAPPPKPSPPPTAVDPIAGELGRLYDDLHAGHRRAPPTRTPPPRPGRLPGLGQAVRVRYGALRLELATDAAGIAQALDQHAGALEACYERIEQPAPRFSLELGFTVGRSGSPEQGHVRDLVVEEPSTAESVAAAQAVGRCAVASLRMLRLPAGRYSFATVRQEVFFGP